MKQQKIDEFSIYIPVEMDRKILTGGGGRDRGGGRWRRRDKSHLFSRFQFLATETVEQQSQEEIEHQKIAHDQGRQEDGETNLRALSIQVSSAEEKVKSKIRIKLDWQRPRSATLIII